MNWKAAKSNAILTDSPDWTGLWRSHTMLFCLKGLRLKRGIYRKGGQRIKGLYTACIWGYNIPMEGTGWYKKYMVGCLLKLLYLGEKHHEILAVFFCAFGTGRIPEIKLLYFLIPALGIYLHLLHPLTGVMVRSLKNLGEICSGKPDGFKAGSFPVNGY